jgi:ribosome-binding ATPase YchF (GTP1/OBG family)
MEIIKNELILKDFEFLNKRLSYPQGSTSIEEWNTLLKAKQLLIGKQMIRNGLWKNEEISLLNTYQFLTAKPIIYLINMSTKDFISKENAWLEKIKEWVGLTAQRDVIPYSAAHEVTQDEKGIRMIPQIVKVIRNALGLINFFTAGTYEVRCWTVRRETKMPSAAGLIHIDFKTGFHCAEVMKFTDLAALGNE